MAFRRSSRCLEHSPRKPSWPASMCGRTQRPDIWTQAIRSNHCQRLAGRRPSTYGIWFVVVLARAVGRRGTHFPRQQIGRHVSQHLCAFGRNNDHRCRPVILARAVIEVIRLGNQARGRVAFVIEHRPTGTGTGTGIGIWIVLRMVISDAGNGFQRCAAGRRPRSCADCAWRSAGGSCRCR